jgi:hypothetical protein
MFAATAPDRNEASLGVTLVELLRGDIPSVLRNYRKLEKGAQSAAKAAGSEYLNNVFGWQPLINEAANVIKVGMTLDRAVHYETFRRKRHWDGPSAETGQTAVVDYLSSTPAMFGAYSHGASGRLPSLSGDSITYDGWETKLTSEDYVFTSRYTGLAKPSMKANYHNDKALEIVQRLGLVDDPRLIWDLMPYSWLVDWFTTMGASVANASVYAPISGKYTADFAYVTTRHVVDERRGVIRIRPTPYGRLSLSSAVSTALSTSKWRTRATPFGFGTQLGSLNASQFAILSALGLSRTR